MKQLLIAALCIAQPLAAASMQEKDFKVAFPKHLQNKSLEYRPAVSRWQGEELSIYSQMPRKRIVSLSAGGSLCGLLTLLPDGHNRHLRGERFVWGILGAICFAYAGKLYLEGRVKTLLFTLDSVGVKEHGSYVLKWNEVESVSTERFFKDEFHFNVDETARYFNKMGVELWVYKRTDNLPIEFNDFLKLIEFFSNKYKKQLQA